MAQGGTPGGPTPGETPGQGPEIRQSDQMAVNKHLMSQNNSNPEQSSFDFDHNPPAMQPPSMTSMEEEKKAPQPA